MLHEQMIAEGGWLFRWRSYLPFVLLLPLAVQLQDHHWPLNSHALHTAWELFCWAVSMAGLGVRSHVALHAPGGTSGRNTREQIADSLNTTGMYSVVRNPLYLGNFLIWLGIALFCVDWRFVATFVLAFWLYYERIVLAEESFLVAKFGADFRAWTRRTPVFVPARNRWVKPDLPPSWKTLLKREYTGLFGIAVAFSLLCAAEHFVVERRVHIETHWLVITSLCSVAYVTLRWAKRHTSLLEVDGR